MPRTPKSSADTTRDVDGFLAALDHPHKPAILALRDLILRADASITEGIKWNAPSFCTSEHFATVHLRAKDGVALILHVGAKKRDDVPGKKSIPDPGSLLQWLAKDRAMVTFRDAKDVAARKSAFTALIREWIRHV